MGIYLRRKDLTIKPIICNSTSCVKRGTKDVTSFGQLARILVQLHTSEFRNRKRAEASRFFPMNNANVELGVGGGAMGNQFSTPTCFERRVRPTSIECAFPSCLEDMKSIECQCGIHRILWFSRHWGSAGSRATLWRNWGSAAQREVDWEIFKERV